MQLFLIKAGKAFATLKREGLFRGGKRVAVAFSKLFHRVKPADVLFISSGVGGDSARYRIFHLIEELQNQGISASATSQDNPFLKNYPKKFHVFIFQRVLFTPSIAQFIREIKKQNKPIFFGTDDLVFDPQYLSYMDYFQKMNSFEKKLYEKGVGGEILADEFVRYGLVSTSFLQKKLEEKGKKVFLVRNKLCQKDLQIAEKILQKKHPQKDTLLLGYASGTASHDKDFAVILKPLEKLMKKYPQIRLFIGGPLQLDEKFYKHFFFRIIRAPFVPRAENFQNLANLDINLAPLEINNPFCMAKSEIKFTEAGLVATPTVATATQTFKEAIVDGVDGFWAENQNQWLQKLELLIQNKTLRKKLGQAARKKVLQKYTTQTSDNPQFIQLLKTFSKKATV